MLRREPQGLCDHRAGPGAEDSARNKGFEKRVGGERLIFRNRSSHSGLWVGSLHMGNRLVTRASQCCSRSPHPQEAGDEADAHPPGPQTFLQALPLLGRGPPTPAFLSLLIPAQSHLNTPPTDAAHVLTVGDEVKPGGARRALVSRRHSTLSSVFHLLLVLLVGGVGGAVPDVLPAAPAPLGSQQRSAGLPERLHLKGAW